MKIHGPCFRSRNDGSVVGGQVGTAWKDTGGVGRVVVQVLVKMVRLWSCLGAGAIKRIGGGVGSAIKVGVIVGAVVRVLVLLRLRCLVKDWCWNRRCSLVTLVVHCVCYVV